MMLAVIILVVILAILVSCTPIRLVPWMTVGLGALCSDHQ